MDSLLSQAVTTIKAGDKATGRKLLLEFLETNPNHENALLWLSATTNDRNEKRTIFRQVLEINPANEKARQALAKLGGDEGPSLEEMTGKPSKIRRLPTATAPAAAPVTKRSPVLNFIAFIILLCAGLFIAGFIYNLLFARTQALAPVGRSVVLLVDSHGPFINVSYVAGTEAMSADQVLNLENDQYLWQRPVDVGPGDLVSITATGPIGEGITCQVLVDGRVWLQSGGVGICSVIGTMK